MGDIGRLKTNWKGSAHVRGNAADRSPESVATVLRNARILLGYDLQEVANSLNIRGAHLEALEEGRFADLPPLVYAQGFVAAYAHFLELDKAELISRFREEASGSPAPLPAMPQFNLNTEPDSAERRIPSAAVIIAGFVLVIVAYGFWQASMPDRRDTVLSVPPLPTRFVEEAFAPAPAFVIPAPAPVVTAPPAAAGEVVAMPVQPAAPAGNARAVSGYTGAGIISLRAYGETWVQFRNEAGQRVGSLVMRPGQNFTIPSNWGRVQLSTGNLGSLAIMVDGRLAPQHNDSGRARYEVVLEPARLLDGSAVLN